MPDANGALIMRYQWASYMLCGSGNTAAFNLIGEGFTSFPESKNPKEYSRKYINYQTEKTDVIGYAPSIAYSCDVITGDPVVMEIVEITDKEAVGTATHRDVVSVNLWEPVNGSENTYKASKRTYAIVPEGKGDGTDALIYTGTMKAVSDNVYGTFNTSTKKFVADGETAPEDPENPEET